MFVPWLCFFSGKTKAVLSSNQFENSRLDLLFEVRSKGPV